MAQFDDAGEVVQRENIKNLIGKVITRIAYKFENMAYLQFFDHEGNVMFELSDDKIFDGSGFYFDLNEVE